MTALDRLRAAVQAVTSADPDEARAIWRAYTASEWLADSDALAGEPDAPALLEGLRGVHGFGRTVDTYARVLRDKAKAAASKPALRLARPDEPGVPLSERLRIWGLRDCPAGLRVPEGYALTGDGIVRLTDDGEVVVAHAPMVVVGSGEDAGTGRRYLRLAWRLPGGGWCTRSVDRALAMQARRVVELADDGAPVTSVSASALVQYLAAQEAACAGVLPLLTVVRRSGWVDEGTYMLGARVIARDAYDVDRYTLEPPSAGEAQWYREIHERGTWTGWLAAWDVVQAHPRAALAVYAAVAPALRGIVAAMPGAMVEWAGRTSGGKSITLDLAASVWGSPGLVRRWDTTGVGAEVGAAAAYDLPLMLDDTKALLSGSSERRREHGAGVITATVYLATGSKGRLRGSVDGLREQRDVRTWLLSTAETPSVDLATDVGVRPRTLTVTGRPFGDDAAVGGMAATVVSAAVREHYGHLGRMVVAWLAMPGHGDVVRGWYMTHVQRAAGGDAIQQRIALLIAAILTARDVCAAVGLPACEPAVDAVVEAARYSLQAASTHHAALRAVWGIAAAQGRLHDGGGYDSTPRVPAGGWMGAIGGGREAAILLETPTRQELRRLGYDAQEVIDQWRAEGWLHLTASGRERTNRRVAGQPPAASYILTPSGVAAASVEEA